MTSQENCNDQGVKRPASKFLGSEVGVIYPEKEIQDKVVLLKVALIDPNPEQPRKKFESEEIEQLARSIKFNGLIQPLIVTQSSVRGRYTLIAGERRLRAVKSCGMGSVLAIVKKFARGDWLRIALTENIQRANLNCIEEAMAYQSLIDEYQLTQEQCARELGKDRTTITNFLRLLKLPPIIQGDLAKGKLQMGHAKALLSLKKEHHAMQARNIILTKILSVRESEKLCRTLNLGEKKLSEDKSSVEADLEYIASQLRSFLKTKVRLVGSGTRGKIEVSYFSSSELERILNQFKET